MRQRGVAKVERVWAGVSLPTHLTRVEQLWQHCSTRIVDQEKQGGITSGFFGVVLVLPDGTSAQTRAALAKVSLAAGTAKHVALVTTSAMVAFSHGVDTALIVDMGARGTRCSAICAGCLVDEATCFSPRAGHTVVRTFRVSPSSKLKPSTANACLCRMHYGRSGVTWTQMLRWSLHGK